MAQEAFRDVRALGIRPKKQKHLQPAWPMVIVILKIGETEPRSRRSINVFRSDYHDPLPEFRSQKHMAKVFLD